MRLITQLWMLLALVLIERNIAKAEEPEVMYIDDSSGDGDDEDYSTEAPGEIGSGTTEGVPKNPTQAIVVTKPKFDNTIRILKVANKKVEFIQEYSDPNSVESQEMFDLVCSVVVASLQQNEVTSGAESCTGVSITEGSLVVKTEVTFSEDTSVSPLDVQGALQDSLSGRTMTDGATALSVDPNSISVVPAGSENDQTQVTVEKTTRKPINVKPDKPEPTPDTMPTTQRSHKGLTDNDVFFDTSPR